MQERAHSHTYFEYNFLKKITESNRNMIEIMNLRLLDVREYVQND